MFRYFFILCCLFGSFTQAFAEATPCPLSHCVAVVDAGSTGSRLHVYAYDLDQTNTPVHITHLNSKKISPGLATLDANQASLDNYLNNLFKDNNSATMPLYFYATAGMRLLPANKQKQMYQAIENWFAKQQQWHLMAAKTITGKEEGVFDWLAVNYHLGKFSANSQPVGVMDMGGASVQIAFPITQNSSVDAKERVTVTLYGKSVQLFVHSFLGLGQTEMSHQFLDEAACYARDYPLPDGEPAAGDVATCKQAVTKLVNEVQHVTSLVQPAVANSPVDWYAIGGIVNLAENPLLQLNGQELTLTALQEQADKALCHASWEELSQTAPNNDYLYLNCLAAAYYSALIGDGYGLSPSMPVHYVPSKDNVDWTLGVVLQH